MGNAEAQGFSLCGKCGLPFTLKGMEAHARFCNGSRPSRSLEHVASGSNGNNIEALEAVEGNETPFTSGRVNNSRYMTEGSGMPSPGFLAPLIVAGGRSSMLSPAGIPRSTTHGSADEQALNSIML